MNIDHMIKMANEISDFFAAESPQGQAPRDVANHLRRYWEARMRREIVAHYRRGAAGLSDIARDAVGLLAVESRGSATPPPQPDPSRGGDAG